MRRTKSGLLACQIAIGSPARADTTWVRSDDIIMLLDVPVSLLLDMLAFEGPLDWLLLRTLCCSPPRKRVPRMLTLRSDRDVTSRREAV